ncbi:MAG: sugar transferase [Pseudomonadota bacterium]
MSSSVDTGMRSSFGFWDMVRAGFSILALVLAAVPMTMTALIVWAVLGRPVLFKQIRAGMGTTPFTIYKFRTMHDTRDSAGNLLPDEDRITPVTKLIRQLRFDELPQLISILRGDMALVGPRPLKPETIEELGRLGYHRCKVRPGLAGWAQVNGATLLKNPQKVALDVWYVENRTFLLDVRILVMAVGTVLFGERTNMKRVEQAEAFVATLEENRDRPKMNEETAP